MKRATAVLLAALALSAVAGAGLAVAGCGDGGVPDDAVATVGDATVSKQDFQTLLAQAQAQMKAQGMELPEKGSESYDQYVAQIVDFLVEEQIVEQSAAVLGVSITDKEVDDEVAELEKAYGGEEQVLALLEEQGMTMALLKRSIRSQTLAQRAAEVVTKGAVVSDGDVAAYWKAHKAQLSKDKKTATLAKARDTIEETLLAAARMELWDDWIARRSEELGIDYADGFDPAELMSSASPSPAG
jgi:peptidyl-prolyl cis-trans isomerase SurA